MKRILLISLLALPIALKASISESQALSRAEEKVNALFKNLRSVSNKDTNSSITSKIKADFEGYFRNNDQDCPNDFKVIANSTYNDIRPARYINMFFDFFQNSSKQNCTFNFEQLNSCIVNKPTYKKQEEPARLAQIVVRKIYKREGKPFAAFNDTLIVGLEEMKIRVWANSTSNHSIGYWGGDVLDVEQMKDKADIAYNHKQYDKAYQIYQAIVCKYPEEGDPYYRMAIMLYKKEYGTMGKKERQRLIIEYLEKAIRHGSSSTRHCADNMKYWLTC